MLAVCTRGCSMQTIIHPDVQRLPHIDEAEKILRNCVHCGFCNAVCPTYQLLGDELDGPRGRIYLIKNLLETNHIDGESVEHLDRCLTCRACETTCPSGVQYGRLLEIGREVIATEHSSRRKPNPLPHLVRWVVPRSWLFDPLLRIGNVVRGFLPKVLRLKIPKIAAVNAHNKRSLKPESGTLSYNVVSNVTQRKVLVLSGCVQKSATPNVNRSLASLLASHDVAVEYLANEGCCGALDLHLSAHAKAKQRMRYLIDKMHESLSDYDAIISTASGCGVTIKEYPTILADDAAYLKKAEEVCGKVVDAVEYLAQFNFSSLSAKAIRVAVHTPCSLQHGQKMPTSLEDILNRAGVQLVATGEKHLCCGSAGSYSLLQPSIASALTARKLDNLQLDNPDVIVTANVGCQMQLSASAGIPVMHWLEFLAQHHDKLTK
jgi:glycolate oxidase iron-sulfur subunit